ncbi:MAG: tRNA-(ms[2]io[6]A)-hydroxylase [Planctomycetota bacterium]
MEGVTLAAATDPAWLPLALERFDEVLADHAHCEKKAASQAISLCAAWPEKVRLVQSLTRLAHEELGHFRQVYDRLVARGIVLHRDRGDPYAKALRALVRHRHEATRLTDMLLVCALIEARSHERLDLLAGGLEDEELRRFYASLAQAEAGHARLFVLLAEEYDDPAAVDLRLRELCAAEAELLASLPLRARIH